MNYAGIDPLFTLIIGMGQYARKEACMKKIITIAMLSVFSLFLFQPTQSYAAEKDEALSFIVFGDNRLPGHLPYSVSEKDKIDVFFEQVKKYAFGPDVRGVRGRPLVLQELEELGVKSALDSCTVK